MRRANRMIRIAVAFVLPFTVTPAAAHDQATGIVKERMDAMETMARAMKAINQRIKANRDLASVKGDAQSIHDLAGRITALSPAGSNQDPSAAKPAIWQQWEDYAARARALATASGKLAGIDARDAKGIAAQARTVSQACTGCHELYRQKHAH